MIIILVVLAVLAAAGLGYCAGIAHAVRVWKRAPEPMPKRSLVEAGVPISSLPCDHCRLIFPEWWCWLGGCV